MSTLEANWNYPSNIHTGAGRLKELPLLCQQLQIQSPLIVTDPQLAKLSMINRAITLCRDADIHCQVFSDIQGNPTGANIEQGIAAYRRGQHDGVIALGGGSALDAGKAIALMIDQNYPIWDFEDVGDNWTRVNGDAIAPVIAIPTTAGTGSEVGRASVITDTETDIENPAKKIIFHPKMQPAMVILDPELTIDLPTHITAATGMDALSHSLEALCSPTYHPMAEGIAIEAIRLVKEFLPQAVADGNNIQARTHMLVASSMGATAFQKGLGAMHALAHPLGAVYNAHHGLLNAILMPYILNANRSKIEERIERLSRYLNLPNPTFNSFLNWILELRQQLNIPHTLQDININADKSERIGAMAAKDPSAGTNPINFDAQAYAEIFRNAVNGEIQA